jgi:flagellar motor switch protein FliN/FliY
MGLSLEGAIPDYSELLDIKVDINVELGIVEEKVMDILSYEKGTVIDLGVPAGESAMIFSNNRYIGNGEIMVFEKNLAVRVNNILGSREVISSLKYD